jgi:nucleoid-associated protein YgaU
MSPDVTKHAIVSEGDSLWGLAHREYGDAGAWRTIADANGVHNPRHLQAGTTLRLPALKR